MADAARRKHAASIAGLSLHIQGDSREIAARARAGFDRKFVQQALELDPTLAGSELEKKVHLLKRLYFKRLALLSAKRRSSPTRRRGEQ